MTKGRARKQEISVQIRYSEEEDDIIEDVPQEAGLTQPFLVPTNYTKVETTKVNRTYYLFLSTSTLSLGAVIISPHPAVQAIAGAVLAGSAGLVQYMLRSAYRGGSKDP